jgi:anti-sigma factor RsiW
MIVFEPPEEEMLLPWYVSGRLSPEENGRVERALATSPTLRQALEAERRLQAAVATAPAPEPRAIDPESLLASLPSRSRAAGWVRPALAAAAVLIFIQAAALVWLLQPAAVYRTASGPAPAAAVETVRYAVHFRDDSTAERIRSALDEARAGVVRGPMPDGAFIIEARNAEQAVSVLTRSGVARAIVRTD